MTTAPAPAPPRRDERWLWLLFAAAWCAHVYFSLQGWDNTLLNRLQFRQVQTAITTLFYPTDRFPLAYETPLFGPPWAIPLELPLFQAIVARSAPISGLSLDATGRLISWLFFQLSLPAFFLLLGSIGVRRPRRLLCLSLLITSPIYLFFSRAFLIESTVLCFSAWFLAAFARWVSGGRVPWLLLSAVTGALAATVKLTTMAVFCLGAAIYSAGFWWNARHPAAGGSRRLALRVLGRSAIGAAGPVAAGVAWLVFSTTVRGRNPEADIFDTVFGYWSFGDLAQRLSLDFWTRTGAVWAQGLLSEGGLVLGVLLFARLKTPFRTRVLGLFAAFLTGQLVFANLYYVHDYYFYANGVFLIFALGLLLAAQFDDEATPRWACWGLPALVILLQLAAYARTYLPPQRTNTPVPELQRVIQDLTRPEDMIVVLGQDWDASIPYYAQRRALMLRAGRERDPGDIARSIERLDRGKVGAVIIFGHLRNDSTFAAATMAPLNLGPTPLLLDHNAQVGVWFPLSRQAEVKDKLPAHPYAALNLVTSRPTAGAAFTLGQRDINRSRQFAALGAMPSRATSVNGFSNSIVNNLTVVNAHAPSALDFPAPAGVREIRAVYGIHDGAYTNPSAQTDGVEFTVRHRAVDGSERVLFTRLLVPGQHQTDQGMQHLELQLAQAVSGEIVIQMGPGPRENASYDWAYLGQVELR